MDNKDFAFLLLVFMGMFQAYRIYTIQIRLNRLEKGGIDNE